jgi:serine/threonine-protein kinase
VWRARHVTLKSHFAVKLLASSAATSEHTRARFLTEAQIAAQLRSRHAVQVYDFGVTDEGQPFLVMELLVGETLADRIDRGRVGPGDVVRILRQCARALDRAHALGIVHRDFKPANILLANDEDGHEIATVVDFGVAKLMGQLEPQADRMSVPLTGRPTSMTRTGTMMGTPQYMAPEQIDGASDIGPRADVWALGVVAYECLVARPPFEADDYDPLFRLIRSGEHTPPSSANNALDPAVDDWFRRACARSPHDRFPTAGEAMDALATALDVVEPAPPSMPLSRTGSSPQAMGPDTVGEIPVARPSGRLGERYAMELEGADESADIELEDVRPRPRTIPTSMPAPFSAPISTPRTSPAPRAPRPSERPPSPPWLPLAIGGGALLVLVAVVAALLVR